MEKYQVTITLVSGKEFTFIVYRNNGRKGILDEIRNTMNGDWYTFIAEHDYVQYSINKNDITSIGISLNAREVKEYDKKVEELEKQISK